MREQLAERDAALASPPKAGPDAAAQAIMSYRLVPDELITRGEAALEMSTVVVPSHTSLINLELPVSSEPRRSYRAALKPFLGKEEILVETLRLSRKTTAGPVVIFSLPANLLADHTDYSVSLGSLNSAGHLDEVGTYTFHVTINTQ
jgi:hypothetical protein